MTDTSKGPALGRVYGQILSLFKKHPLLFLPFILAIVIDAGFFSLILLAPQYPFSLVLAPIVRAFWGEQFLHYPANLFLAPQIFTYARYVISITFGIILSGLAVSLIQQAYVHESLSVWTGLSKAVRRYLRLIVIWLITFAVMYLAIKVPTILPVVSGIPLAVFTLKFLVTVVVQAFFVAAVPAVIIENKKISGAFVRAMAMVKRYPFLLFFSVFIPSVLFLPMTAIAVKMSYIIERSSPDALAYVVYLRIVVTAVVDLLVTAAASLILLMHREAFDAPNGGAR